MMELINCLNFPIEDVMNQNLLEITKKSCQSENIGLPLWRKVSLVLSTIIRAFVAELYFSEHRAPLITPFCFPTWAFS